MPSKYQAHVLAKAGESAEELLSELTACGVAFGDGESAIVLSVLKEAFVNGVIWKTDESITNMRRAFAHNKVPALARRQAE